MKSKLRRLVLALAVSAASSLPAHAVLISDVNNDFAIEWKGIGFSGSNQVQLNAFAGFDITAISSTQVAMTVTFTNLTTVPQLNAGGTTVTEAGVTSFGIGISPNATKVTFGDTSDGGFTGAELQSGQQNFPGGFKAIDICVFTQGCNGGSQNGAIPGNGGMDVFNLLIEGDFAGSNGNPSVIFDPFPIKFQTTIGSFEFAGCVGSGCGRFPPVQQQQVPEPGTTLLFAAALAAIGLTSRRRRKA